MTRLKYVILTEVTGRWKAEIIESYLIAEGIEVQLIQDAVTHYLYKSPFDPVQVFVPENRLADARELLKFLDESQVENDE